jgi:hypothetical protein
MIILKMDLFIDIVRINLFCELIYLIWKLHVSMLKSSIVKLVFSL